MQYTSLSWIHLSSLLPFLLLPPSQLKGTPPVQTAGTTTPRGRRQLPQTPLTPRPAVAYKTTHSSPVQPASTPPCRLSRGMSEHDALLSGHDRSPVPVTRIGSDPNLSPRAWDRSPRGLLEETEDFQDAVSTHGGPRASPRTAAPASTPALASQAGGAGTPPAPTQGRAGVPNGFHFTLGVNAGARGAGVLREGGEEDWC